MPIDPEFQKNRQKVGQEKSIAIWGPVDPPKKLGIRGTYVAVDWDLCTGCGVCLKVCPQQLYEWVDTSGHPTSEKKAFPARELDCVQCYTCEAKCPVNAIRTVYPGLTGWWNVLAWLTFPLLLVQLIGGSIYGIVFGPSLDLQALFYVGWVILVLGILFSLSSLLCFRNRGRPIEGRGLMATTVLVESGTYAIVRHPQFLGMVLMVCAPMFVSQHWLFLLIGVPLIGSIPHWLHEAEANLIAKFGEDYKHYMEKVPRINLVLGIIRLLRRKWRSSSENPLNHSAIM